MTSKTAKCIRDPPINCHYRQCNITLNDDMVPLIIGNDGAHFKRITSMSQTKYIWWNNDIKKIEIWGPEHKLNLAENILKDHIIFIKKKQAEQAEQAEL